MRSRFVGWLRKGAPDQITTRVAEVLIAVVRTAALLGEEVIIRGERTLPVI